MVGTSLLHLICSVLVVTRVTRAGVCFFAVLRFGSVSNIRSFAICLVRLLLVASLFCLGLFFI